MLGGAKAAVVGNANQALNASPVSDLETLKSITL